MSWTTPADLRAQVRKLWDRGALLAALAGAETIFPRRMTLRKPTSRELAERFDDVRRWIARLDGETGPYRLVWRSIRHRTLGANEVPDEVWIDSLDDALGLIGKRREAERFAELTAMTRQRLPALLPWLVRRPLSALELAGHWSLLLDCVSWLQQHPRPRIYLRQVDIPGVHSKFLERHRAVLAELFDLALPESAIDFAHGGIGGFCRRYGFRDKPLRVRFRILDPQLALLPTGTDQDITITHETFARLDLAARRVFITENEINFLAFPAAPKSLVIFGAGYGFDHLAEADWLHDLDIRYWGDIDTHGFAILDQLRAHFPRAASLLMDRQTLLAHRSAWSVETQAETRNLARLTDEECSLYDDLRHNRLGEGVRLEQERVGFERVRMALQALSDDETPADAVKTRHPEIALQNWKSKADSPIAQVKLGSTPSFNRYIGIDYSGAETPDSSLKGLRVYLADRGTLPVEVPPPAGPRKYWTRRGIAEWLVERLSEKVPTLVGIDHGFSFPLRYFEVHHLEPDWDVFLDDFQRHWPTDAEHTYVNFVRDGLCGDGAARSGSSRWRRLADERAGAKSVFHFDVPGSVAKSTHAGLPWLRFLRRRLGDRISFWPFDGWEISSGRSAVVEVYPSLWSKSYPRENRTADQQDAYAAAAWLRQVDLGGSLKAYLNPSLRPGERAVAQVEGWILGVV